MECRNVNELKMDFPVTYLGQTYILKYGTTRELPDGAVPMEGIPGWLICRPNPPKPQMIEIDLTSIYKKVLSLEDQLKAEKVMEESRKISIELAQKNRELKEKANEQDRSQTDSNNDHQEHTETIGSRSTEPINTSSNADTQEDQKPVQEEDLISSQNIQSPSDVIKSENIEELVNSLDVPYSISKSKKPKTKQPLKGFKIKKSIRNKMKEEKDLQIIKDGRKNRIGIIENKVNEKLGLAVSDDFQNKINQRLGL